MARQRSAGKSFEVAESLNGLANFYREMGCAMTTATTTTTRTMTAAAAQKLKSSSKKTKMWDGTSTGEGSEQLPVRASAAEWFDDAERATREALTIRARMKFSVDYGQSLTTLGRFSPPRRRPASL